MAKFTCNSCGATYSDTSRDGVAYYHACPPEIVTPSAADATGKVITAEKRDPRPNVRDERPVPGLQFLDGVLHVLQANPEEKAQSLLVPADKPVETFIVSVGKGRAAAV